MKPRALVVDDDADIIRSVGEILVSLDHDYDAADSVTAARKCIERTEYAYFIIDLQIPVHSGHGLSRIQHGETLIDEIIRQDAARKKRIIAITAHGNDRPVQSVEMMKKGIADYISKPFEETGKTLDKAIIEMLARAAGSHPTILTPPKPDFSIHSLVSFTGGKMVFFSDRVELCGADICSGPRSELSRKVLNLLSARKQNGQFVSYSAKKLAKKLDIETGQDGAIRAVRSLRNRIRDALSEQANIDCCNEDVIVSRGPGYRFSEKLTVQVYDESNQGRGSNPASNNVRNHPISDVPNVGNDNVLNVGKPDVKDASPKARQQWILQRIDEGYKLQAPGVAKHFGCHLKTAQRDLLGLVETEELKYFGSRRKGHYGRPSHPVAEQ